MYSVIVTLAASIEVIKKEKHTNDFILKRFCKCNNYELNKWGLDALGGLKTQYVKSGVSVCEWEREVNSFIQLKIIPCHTVNS